ncbi:hypothetical protein BVRB_000750 [Beta vulgaris subsp. vulgaris]|uniref:Uncharacterized protein n=1 Tax=Beta vulgaris subsp. vulgaris TaxID=3555 RepID=A0A0J8DZH0_BETVV|nr:hypothetical protein BVRB_000750 [Beta vulgaris subsp. vulgaris]
MPSLWKKQKGNRISRLVADLQTTPKRGGSLVVETGFPTSLVDLFVKNRDKLKKPKTKKHKSKKLSAISEDVDDGHIFSPVSNPPVSNCDLEVPICSIVEDCEENVDQIDKKDLFVEETVTHKNPVVELHHDVCKNENNNNNEENRETLEVSNSKNVALLSIFIGVLVFIVVLYTKRWFLALITLGFLVLLLLEYVGNSVFRLFKPCENAVSMSVVKGALVVVVALYTKWFVVGITIGASLLLLLEYAGNSAFGGFKPCQDAKWKLKDILPHWGGSKKKRDFGEREGRKGGRGVLMRAVLIGSKREVYCNERFDWVSRIDFNDEGVGNECISNREIKLENGNDHTSNRENDLVVEDDGDDVSIKEESEEGSGDSTPANEDSRLFEEETQNKSMYEMLSLELNYPIHPRTSNFSGHVGNFDQQGEKGTMEEGEKGSEDTSISRKYKKSKKFWKNFVSKKMSKKKKYKDGREDDNAAHIDNIVDTATEVEEEDEQEDGDQEISEIEESTSVTDDENEREIENLSTAYSCYTETLQTDDITTKSSGIVKEKYGNLKYLTAMVIPLTGLIGGRMFAVVVTIICCLVFKMVRG